MNPESIKPTSIFETLPENHWLEVATRLYQESCEVPDPLQIRVAAIVRALGIPLGESSALTFHEDKERTDEEVKKDKIIAQHLTNKTGVVIDKKTGMVSSDFRDNPDGLPHELEGALVPATRAIMKLECEHARAAREKFGDTENVLEAECPVNYFRLPGGVDFFLRGYGHDRMWHDNHKKFLAEINQYPKIICIEGFVNEPFGDSMDIWWGTSLRQCGDYNALMHEAVEGGFKGLFTEVDARDSSKIQMDSDPFSRHFPPTLSYKFFQKYFLFFEREHPYLGKKIGSPERLEQLLINQSTTEEGLWKRDKKIFHHGKQHRSHAYVAQNGEVSLEPTFLELGQRLFTGALAAIKLHLIAKLMTDGRLPKGPIVDYEGAAHLSSKSFFLRYPYYAMEVVLRTINELMAGRVQKQGNIEEIYQVFKNPNWGEIVKEIVGLHFKEVENDPTKTISPGPNQRKLIDYPIDVLKIYGIDPEKVVPGDEEIKNIRERLAASS